MGEEIRCIGIEGPGRGLPDPESARFPIVHSARRADRAS